MKTEQMEIDETDWKIIKELRTDARKSYREIAVNIDLSTPAVIERIRKMEKSGVIKAYTTSLNFLKLGFDFMGIIQISISHGYLIDAQEKISKLKGVYAVYDVTGEYDCVALIICKSRGELSALIKKILNIPYVQKSNTQVVLNVVKDPYQFEVGP